MLCDLDDTLLDRCATFRRWAQAFAADRKLGAEVVEWLVAKDRGGYRPRGDFVAAVAERFSPAGDFTVETFQATFTSLFRCGDDVAAALRDARSHGWKIAVVTNGSRSQLDKVTAARLAPLVDAVCVSDVEGCRKPDPQLLRIAANRVGNALEGAWMIGDSAEADIGAAAAVGIKSVWLRHGRTWTLPHYRPTSEADSFTDAANTVLASGSWRP